VAVVDRTPEDLTTRLGEWNGDADWRTLAFDLTARAGRSVSLRFAFDSDGSVTGRGVWIDDVALSVECGGR